jgi:putative transposase
MSRKTQTEKIGYFYIVNEGAKGLKVFNDHTDSTRFLTLLCDAGENFSVKVHSYTLMVNKYYLLVQTTQDNLSDFMRQINGGYATYANKKYARSGRLWKGRFNATPIVQKEHLDTLVRYIEQLPVKEKLTKVVGRYQYSSSYFFSQEMSSTECLQYAFVYTEMKSVQERREFLNTFVAIKDVKGILKPSKKKEAVPDQTLETLFSNYTTKDERNTIVVSAYKDGYTQSSIAKFLGLAPSTVSAIIRSNK